MKNLDDAIALYNYAMESPLIVHNCTLKVSYSIHQHLQSNPHDYKPSNIILITFCGSAKAPITLFDLANVYSIVFYSNRCATEFMRWLRS